MCTVFLRERAINSSHLLESLGGQQRSGLDVTNSFLMVQIKKSKRDYYGVRQPWVLSFQVQIGQVSVRNHLNIIDPAFWVGGRRQFPSLFF